MHPRFLRQATIRSSPRLQQLATAYDLPLYLTDWTLPFTRPVTCLIGDNGVGKSVLLEGLARCLGFDAAGGPLSVNPQRTLPQDVFFKDELRVIRHFHRPKSSYFFRAETFHQLASYIDDTGYLGGYGGVPLHRLSHGQAFMTLLQHKFNADGLYLLDEPEAALSPMLQLAAARLIYELACQGAQFLIVTHSPVLMAIPDASLLQLQRDGIQPVAYQDTEHYIVMKRFYGDTDAYLRHNLGW